MPECQNWAQIWAQQWCLLKAELHGNRASAKGQHFIKQVCLTISQRLHTTQ